MSVAFGFKQPQLTPEQRQQLMASHPAFQQQQQGGATQPPPQPGVLTQTPAGMGGPMVDISNMPGADRLPRFAICQHCSQNVQTQVSQLAMMNPCCGKTDHVCPSCKGVIATVSTGPTCAILWLVVQIQVSFVSRCKLKAMWLGTFLCISWVWCFTHRQMCYFHIWALALRINLNQNYASITAWINENATLFNCIF